MPRLKFAITLFILSSHLIYSQTQENSVVFYCDDTPYLIPEIENILNSLKKDSNIYFTTVTNLTRLRENLFDDFSIDEFISAQVDKVIADDPMYSEIRNKIIEEFNRHKYFLKINIHQLGELLEFQFILYETLPFKESIDIDPNYIFRLSRNIESPSKTHSIFVNPEKNNYLDLITLGIKRVFRETNSKPKAIIKADTSEGNKTKYGFLRWDINDTLRLSAAKSYDDDSPKSFLKYQWTLYPSQFTIDTNSFKVIHLNGEKISNEKDLNLVFDSLGSYFIGLTVNDQISESEPVFFMVSVTEAPILYSTNYIRKSFFHQESLKEKIKNIKYSYATTLVFNYEFLNTFNDWTLSIRHESEYRPNKNQKRLWEIYKKEKRASDFDTKFLPRISIIGRKIKNDSILTRIQFVPLSTDYTYNSYDLSAQIDPVGVKSNKEFFSIDYISSNGFKLRVDSYSFGARVDERYYKAEIGADPNDFPLDDKFLRNQLRWGIQGYLTRSLSVHFGGPINKFNLYLENNIDLETTLGNQIQVPFFDTYRYMYHLGVEISDNNIVGNTTNLWYNTTFFKLKDIEALDYHYNFYSSRMPEDESFLENLDDINCVCERTGTVIQHLLGASTSFIVMKKPLIQMEWGLIVGFTPRAKKEDYGNLSLGFQLGSKIDIFSIPLIENHAN